MSKKRKRKNRSGSPSGQPTPSGSGTSARKLPDNFDPDYTYVIKDLRTIGILAGIFLTILISLSFFL
ncbi:MAG: hypothetical protein IMY85_05640 [Chloroflexi bacterium]|nr:hypothetical protein [Chloroflexota bacterium]